MNQSDHRARIPAILFRISQHILLLMLLVINSPKAFSSPQDIWQKGNAFYQHKQYDSAVIYFEQIAASKPADATLFYNLGNTYYRLNKIGLSVLNYERALKRNPSYKEASENLLLAQSRIPGGIGQQPQDIFFIRWWKAITSPGLIMFWSVLSLLFFIGLIGLLLYRRLQRNQVYIRPQYFGTLTLLWLASLLLAVSSVYATLSNTKAVVISGEAAVSRIGIKSRYASGAPEGTVVNLLSRNGSNFEVELPDGNTGIIQQSALMVID